MTDEDTATWVNRLLELLHDSRDGYKECAEEVNNDYLRRLFTTLAEVRQEMIGELQDKARQLNIEYEKSGSTLAAGHRLFIDLKSLLTDGDSQAIIEEIKRGESYAIERYQEALNQPLPPDVIETIRTQLSKLQNNLAQVAWRENTTA